MHRTKSDRISVQINRFFALKYSRVIARVNIQNSCPSTVGVIKPTLSELERRALDVEARDRI